MIKTILTLGFLGGGTYAFVKYVLPKLKGKPPEEQTTEEKKEEQREFKEVQPKPLKADALVFVTGDSVNIRAEPSRLSKIIQKVSKGTSYYLSELVHGKDDPKYRWGKIHEIRVERRKIGAVDVITKNPLGYIREDFLQYLREVKKPQWR